MRPFPVTALAAAAATFLLLLGAVSCSSTSTPPTAPSAAPATSAPASAATAKPRSVAAPSTVYANDPAKPVAAKVGETIALRVDTDASSSDGWQIVSYDQDKLYNVGATYDQPTASTVPGHPVTQNLLFRATAPGNATVVLRYGQSDTTSASDTKVTFTITVS